jgi:hypothetical protein
MENGTFAMKMRMWTEADFERTQLSLENTNSFDVRRAFYPEHSDRWNEFEEVWSQDDRTNWKNLLKRVTRNEESKKNLTLALTQQEEAWIADFVWRAMVWGFLLKRSH